jgi:iron complex transport system permease protein
VPRILTFLALTVLVPLAALASLVVGANAQVGVNEAWSAVFAFDGSAEHAIVIDQRVPRTVLALLAGLALAVSGAVSQALTRNDLGSPDILGSPPARPSAPSRRSRSATPRRRPPTSGPRWPERC